MDPQNIPLNVRLIGITEKMQLARIFIKREKIKFFLPPSSLIVN